MEAWLGSRPDDFVAVSVSGEPGIGKTSLCATFVERIGENDYVYISATDSALRRPGHILRQAVLGCWSISEPGPQWLADAMTEAKIVGRWQPLIFELFGMAAAENEWTRELSPELRLEKTAELIGQLIIAPERPRTLLIFDDLEFADSYSRSLLHALAANQMPDGAFMILAGSDTIVDIPDKNRQLSLGPLDDQYVRELLHMYLVPGTRETQLIDILAARSEGNPLYLSETVKDLRRQGILSHLSDTERLEVVKPITELRLADKIEDLQLAAFDALPEEQRSLLKAAAVLGVSFSTDFLAGICDGAGSDLIARMLAELTRRGFLIALQSGRWRFVRRQTRDAIYNCITELERRRLHLRAARLISVDQAEERTFELAYHFSRSDDTVRGFHFALAAAEQSLATGMLMDAAEYLGRCDGLLRREDTERIPVMEQLNFYRQAAEVAVLDGDYSRAFGYLRPWRHLARANGSLAECRRAANEFARLVWKQSRFARLTRILQLLLSERVNTSAAVLADSYAILGEFKRRTGDFREAETACREAISQAQSAGSARREADALNSLGLTLWGMGQLQQARMAFTRSLELGQAELGKSAEAKAANNLAILAEEMGDYTAAEKLLRQARAIYVDIGDRRNGSYSAGNLANILTCFGRYREALNLFAAADRVFVATGETHPHMYTLGNIGDIEMMLGDSHNSLAKFQQVLEFAQKCSDEELVAETKARLANHEFYYGDTGKAEQLFRGAIAVAKAIGSLEYQVQATIGLCRLHIGARATDKARKELESLRSLAGQTGSDRTRYEAEFIEAELLRISGEPDPAVERFLGCVDYAEGQNQFELSLKSYVRLYELSPVQRDKAEEKIKQLLRDYIAANGTDLFRKLMNSAYYRFFTDPLRILTRSDSLGLAPQAIG
jgi:tetratricopeptide (TPR) repeat protein